MNEKTYSVVKVFDKRSNIWHGDREYNEITVKHCLEYLFTLLKRNGYLFLNDVYQILGLPLTREGQVSGWVYNDMIKTGILWTTWRKNADEVDVHITFEPMENILDALPSEEEL